jgi:hypothetical protein
MAGIVQPITDIVAILRTILVVNGDGNTVTPHVRIWNNQVRFEHEGKQTNFIKPAFFLEVVNDVQYEELGKGFQAADVGFRVHIVHEYYDAQDGTFEQDLPIFDLRDKVRAKLSLVEVTACGPLCVVREGQDYEHTNIYHYIIEFVCNFIDSKGSPLDPSAGKYIDSTPPLTLQLTETIVPNIPNSPPDAGNYYKIPT